MKENLLSLAKLLATDDAFNIAFSSKATDEEKYKLVKTKFTDLTREDFLEFLQKLSEAKKASMAELSPDEMEMVAGGAGSWVTKLAAVTIFVTALGATGVASQQVDASHRNPKKTTDESSREKKDGKKPKPDRNQEKHKKPLTARHSQPAPLWKQIKHKDGASLSTIKLGQPRSEIVEYIFDHRDKPALEILREHRDKNIGKGSSSLIGELAQVVESRVHNKLPTNLSGITFQLFTKSGEVMANTKQTGTYNQIIDKMVKDGSATQETAEQILENLSKACISPSGQQSLEGFDINEFNDDFIENLAEELFENLSDSAKKLVAVLLCECIRFNDDGAFVRWAMRCVLDIFMKPPKKVDPKTSKPTDETINCNAFEEVFTSNGINMFPLAIFARSSKEMGGNGGKQQTLDLFFKNTPIDYEGEDLREIINSLNAGLLESTVEFVSLIDEDQGVKEEKKEKKTGTPTMLLDPNEDDGDTKVGTEEQTSTKGSMSEDEWFSDIL